MTAEQAAAVFRRAAELDRAVPVVPDGLDQGSLEDIAAEVGLSPEAVRRASLELKAGLLDPRPPTRGPSLRVQRHLPGEVDGLLRQLEAELRRQTYVAVRRRPDGLLAVRSKGLVAKVNRKIDPLGRQILSRTGVDAVEAQLASAAGRTVVRLEADLTRVRRAWLAMPAGGVLTAAFMMGGALIGGVSTVDVMAVPAAGAVIAGSVAGGRSGYRSARRDAARALEGLLDRLE